MGKHEDDGDEALSFLEELEAAFRRMIVGVFRFIFVRFPIWVYDLFQDFFDLMWRFVRYTVRFTVRLVRALFFGAVWAALVFGPLAATQSFKSLALPALQGVGICWAAGGVIGSIWALNRWWRQKQARARKSFDYDEGRKSILQSEVSAGGILVTVLILAGTLLAIGWYADVLGH